MLSNISHIPRKRRASYSPKLNTLPPGTTLPSESQANISVPALLTEDMGKKRGRTNTPWTPQEEQRLKQMRDAGHSWSEISKVRVKVAVQEIQTLIGCRHFPLEQKGV
jgi:hypothetical protein